MKVKILLTISFLFFFPILVKAANHYVSPTGTASWSACLDINTPCSLNTANQNAVAGDTVNLLGGIYTDQQIRPTHSGTPGNVIFYKAYNGESVTITGTNVIAIQLQGDNYIKVDGITASHVSRWLLCNNNSNYNEISNCLFEYATLEGIKIYTGTGASTHNWFHNNVVYNMGRVNSNNCDDQGHLMYVGIPGDYISNYNTIEDNVFYHGGHHCLETHSKYNIIRNNIFHNEGWMEDTNGSCSYSPNVSNNLYGNRNLFISDLSDSEGIYVLAENNRIGNAGRPPDDDGGHNLVLEGRRIIARYNYIFNAANDGLYLRGANSDNNRIYNNTIYNNGQNEGHQYLRRNGITIVQNSSSNIFKNNISYNNYNHDFADWGDADNTFTNNWVSTDGDPLFINADLSNPKSLTLPDLSLQNSSLAINAGTYLTNTVGADNSSLSLVVDDAMYFQDGSWGSDLARGISLFPDWLAIGTVDNVVQISSINYDTNTITLASPKTWNDNAPVWLYKNSAGEIVLYGSSPDIGAYEYPSSNPEPPTPQTFSFQFQRQAKTTHQDTATLTFYTPGASNPLYTISNKQTNSQGLASNITPSETLPSGTYDIQVKIPYYLPKKLTNQTWPPTNTLNFGILKSGDLNNDNNINASDLAVILSNWQTSNSTSDLNQDGQINSLDFSFINQNWNQHES